VAVGDLADLLVDLLPASRVALAGDEVTVTDDDPRALWAAEVAAWAHGFEAAGRETRRVRFRRFTP
jgi:hypothetical protein